jgi:hypothetical protein
LEDFHKEFQAKVIDDNVAQGNQEVPNYLCSASQSGASEADVTCHPKAGEESNGELEHKSGDMRGESNETQIKHFATEHKMIKHIVKHPFQGKVQAATTAVTEQIQRHELLKRRIEKVDDRNQQLFNAFLYVSDGSHL